MSATCWRKTSAWKRKVVVSDQLRTEADMCRPPREKSSDSIFVKGQGPAIQNTRAFRNTFPSPASSEAEPIEAFHLPSGEEGPRGSRGTMPVWGSWKLVTPVPMFIAEFIWVE